MTTLVHLVYVHGFQGNDTTFQSFPKDLQEHISAKIPPELNIRVQSSLYPTYKSIKPISHATKNFIEWLSTQPEGPVILMGHSMGGLLVADAATDPSNNPPPSQGKPRPKRIVGVIAFDTPYLGMHPHVVISGIASLLPSDKGETEAEAGPDGEKKLRSEKSMNKHPQIKIIDPSVTDEWEAFKAKAHIHPSQSPYHSSNAENSSSSARPSLSSLATSSSSLASRQSRPTSPSIMNRFLAHISPQEEQSHPVVKWLRKHADDPISAGKRWVTEHLQFGSCMFDPSDLKDRYSRLVEWEKKGGLWVNYWTCTPPKVEEEKQDDKEEKKDDNDQDHPHPPLSALSDVSSSSIATTNTVDTVSSTRDEPSTPNEKEDGKDKSNKASKKKKKVAKRGHHFVVLPNGMGGYLGGWEKWENIVIAGVKDEVNAHTGLFIPTSNPEYPALVERVSDKILGWCQLLAADSSSNVQRP